jgi:PAS domain S-box-containing protein
VDDKKSIRKVVSKVLNERGFKVTQAANDEEAFEIFKNTNFPIVIADTTMQETSCIEFLYRIKKLAPETQVVDINNYTFLGGSIPAHYSGTYEKIIKPFRYLEEISITSKKAMKKARLVSSNSNLIKSLKRKNKQLSCHRDYLQQLLDKRTAELKMSEEKFRELYKKFPIPVYIWKWVGPDNFILVGYNMEAEEQTDGMVIDLSGRNAKEVFYECPVIFEDIKTCYFKKTTVKRELECKFLNNGKLRHLSIQCNFTTPGFVSVYTEDITENKLAEAALRKSEEKHRALVENIPDIIYSMDMAGKIIAINLPAVMVYGYQSQEIIGQSFASFIHFEDRDMVIQTLSADSKKHREFTRRLQFRLIDKAEAVHWVEMNARNLFDARGNFLQQDGVLRDITRTKFLQEQLIRSERLAATGQLAASIAHEINSPLQGISALLNYIGTTHKYDEELAQNIDLVKGAFQSISKTVKNLLDLNRPGNETKQIINVNKVIETTVSLVCCHLKHKKVKINLNICPKIPSIKASPQQLGQVFMNLINNAVEAMIGISNPKDGWRKRTALGGEITISTQFRNDEINIKLADTGPGISNEDLEHIFDPFYTRKKTMGIGIGLSICHGIIEDHNGTITAKNSADSGAVFTIKLPVNLC